MAALSSKFDRGAAYRTRHAGTCGGEIRNYLIAPTVAVIPQATIRKSRITEALSAGADLNLGVYVPRQQLISFVEDARYQLLKSGMPLVYGTIRFIERDKEAFLTWAKQSYACVIFTPHVAAGIPRCNVHGIFAGILNVPLQNEAGAFI